MADVIAKEAPISKSLLCKRVINSFGITRMGTRISSYMDHLLNHVPFRTSGTDAIFYWSNAQIPGEYSNYRPDSGREALDIAPEEIAVAICRVLEEQVSLPVDSLVKEIAQRFHYARVGDNVQASINRAIDYALATDRIILANNRLKLHAYTL